MPLKTCEVCGKPARGARCPAHPAGSSARPRGNAYEPTRQRIAARDAWTCAICGQPIDPKLRRPHPRALHVHHATPRSLGGSDADQNLRATHAECNLRKGPR